jgi:hypothetical protein
MRREVTPIAPTPTLLISVLTVPWAMLFSNVSVFALFIDFSFLYAGLRSVFCL